MISQRAVDDPRTLLVMSMYHAGGAVSRINTIGRGGLIDFMTDFLPGGVARVLVEEGITDVVFVPAMIEAPPVRVLGFADLEFPRLDTNTFGASPIVVETLQAATPAFGCRFVQVFGMTETIAVMTALFPNDHERALAGEEHLSLSAGRAILATEVRTVDLEASAAALAGRWIHTGEGGSLDDEGLLFVSDRVNDMIFSEGVNTYPREIEDGLVRLRAVADAAAIGVPDEKWGETVKAAI
jgi:acyl-CoA synthetase (AMP-forming)/AMP-acid ligase II